MKNTRIGGAALALCLMTATAAAQGNDPSWSDFTNQLNPGQLRQDIFDRGSPIEYLGSAVLVAGEKNGQRVVYVIGTYDKGAAKVYYPLGPEGLQFVWPTPKAPKSGAVGALFTQLNPVEECKGAPSEPVLAQGQESGYAVNWCNRSTDTPSNKFKKKNYYYLFANGDASLVMTLRYDCGDAADKAAMPATVRNTCP